MVTVEKTCMKTPKKMCVYLLQVLPLLTLKLLNVEVPEVSLSVGYKLCVRNHDCCNCYIINIQNSSQV